jgi:hypothetical protein
MRMSEALHAFESFLFNSWERYFPVSFLDSHPHLAHGTSMAMAHVSAIEL